MSAIYQKCCNNPAPYKPQGVTAMMMPYGQCENCGKPELLWCAWCGTFGDHKSGAHLDANGKMHMDVVTK